MLMAKEEIACHYSFGDDVDGLWLSQEEIVCHCFSDDG